MSRVANNPITIPAGVEINFAQGCLTVKSTKHTMQRQIPALVEMVQEDKHIHFRPLDQSIAANALAGSMRALVNNMVVGVSKGFEKKLELIGVGFRAQLQGKKLNLTLGFSHPVVYTVPDGISVETPSQTEIVIKGFDKEQVGQVAANIRAYRMPEPYKGKGVRYANEKIVLKETKKK